ncbi:unnamed protein product, partial [marine sediment metagenome]
VSSETRKSSININYSGSMTGTVNLNVLSPV